MIDTHFDREKKPIRFLIRNNIVYVIFGSLLFHLYYLEGINRDWAFSVFAPIDHPPDRTGDNVQVGDGTGKNSRAIDYIAKINISTCFLPLVNCVVCGASFRIESCLMHFTLDNSGISLHGGFTDAVDSNYTRVMGASSLQFISDSLSKL